MAAARNSRAAGLQVLPLERDVAEQQVRVHLDLGVGAIDRGCRRAGGEEHDGEQQRVRFMRPI